MQIDRNNMMEREDRWRDMRKAGQTWSPGRYKAGLTCKFSLIVGLLLILVMTLVACSSFTPAVVEPEAGDGAEMIEPTEAEVPKRESVVARLQRGEPLVAGVKVDSQPWGFLDESGDNVGFDVALIEAMAERWGVEVEFISVTSANRLEKLAVGEVDLVAASMTHRRDREEFNDFSITYFLDGQALLVREDSGIETMVDLDRKAVAAARGTTSMENLRAEANELGIQVAVVEVDDHPAGLKDVVAGTVDAYTTDASILAGLAKQEPGLMVTGGPFSYEPYGMGLPACDSHFRDLVNFTLQDLYRDGTYAKLYEAWLLGGNPEGINVGGEIFQMESWPDGNQANYILN